MSILLQTRDIPKLLITDKIRFITKFLKHSVDGPNGDCWSWRGSKNNRGYGFFAIKRKNYLAHRVSYVFHNKKQIPEGKVVVHRCENNSCVNPDHLYLMSNKSKMPYSVSKFKKISKAIYLSDLNEKDMLLLEKINMSKKLKFTNADNSNLPGMVNSLTGRKFIRLGLAKHKQLKCWNGISGLTEKGQFILGLCKRRYKNVFRGGSLKDYKRKDLKKIAREMGLEPDSDRIKKLAIKYGFMKPSYINQYKRNKRIEEAKKTQKILTEDQKKFENNLVNILPIHLNLLKYL